MKQKEYFDIAFEEAKKSFHNDEVPVGAVIVQNGKIISTGHNAKEFENCVLEHAELNAIKEASKKLNNWRLNDCDIYVTLEPCEMCAAAIKQARIRTIYSALSNDDQNIHSRVVSILDKDKSNPQVLLINDLEKERAKKLLNEFFVLTRNK